ALIQACRHCCKISQAIWVGDCSFIHGTGEHSKHHKVQGSRFEVQGSRVKGQGSSKKSKALWGKTPSYHKLNSCHTHSPKTPSYHKLNSCHTSKALWGKTPSYHKLNSCHTNSPTISVKDM